MLLSFLLRLQFFDLTFCSLLLSCPATPTSSTARPRPPWFSSVGPAIWNTIGLQNASVPTTVATPVSSVHPSTLFTTTTTDGQAVFQLPADNQQPPVVSGDANLTTSTTTASTTTASTTTPTTTASTTTPLPNLLVELTEVTVLVPDFPGRRPQSSSTPLPSTTASIASVDEDSDLDMGLDVVDQEDDQDLDGDLITTPGSITTGKIEIVVQV